MNSLSIYLAGALAPSHWLNHPDIRSRVLASHLGQALECCEITSQTIESSALPPATMLEQALAQSHRLAPAELAAVSGIYDQQSLGSWRLDPVVLRLAIDHLVLSSEEESALSEKHSMRLLHAIGPLFFEHGGQIQYAAPNRWYWKTATSLDFQSSSVSTARGRSVEGYYPKGPDAASWRKLLNEAQMTWFSHDVNSDRERTGLAAINGLWISGPVTAPGAKPYQTYLGSRACLAEFLAKACGANFQELGGEPNAATNASCIIDQSLAKANQDADPLSWIEAFELLSSALAPLLDTAKARQDSVRWILCGDRKIVYANRSRSNPIKKVLALFSPSKGRALSLLLEESDSAR